MTKLKTSKSRKPAQTKRPHPEHPPKGPCAVPECNRRAYARGLCQTHHRQMLTTGKLAPIRPYRSRSKDTVKFAGLRLSHRCAQLLQRRADERGDSLGATIADVLQAWAERTQGSRSM